MELVAIAASETQSPRRNIAKAVKRVFIRICVFYMVSPIDHQSFYSHSDLVYFVAWHFDYWYDRPIQRSRPIAQHR